MMILFKKKRKHVNIKSAIFSITIFWFDYKTLNTITIYFITLLTVHILDPALQGLSKIYTSLQGLHDTLPSSLIFVSPRRVFSLDI